MKFTHSLLAAAAFALACGGVVAADDKEHKGFNDMDKNADGKLTRAEAKGKKDLLAKWKEADTDGDGVLTRAEYLKAMAKQDVNTVRRKVTGDDDKSHQASRDDKHHKGFNDMDKNNDGKLSRSEAAGKKSLLAKWKQLDTDGDGSLSRVEYLKEMARQDAATVKNKVSKEAHEVKRRAPDASTGPSSERK